MKTLSTFVALLFAIPLASLNAADNKPPRPNIVLIISDDQGAGDYSFMGHPHVQTPHIDKLASQSLVFPRGFVPTSVCCPSLATIITGLYPHQHKITANDPPAAKDAEKGSRGSSKELTSQWNAALDHVPTLPRLLSAEGYLSFQTGKWWHGDFSRGGFTHGMTKGIRHGDAGLTIGREGLQPIYDFVSDARKQEKPFLLWYAPFMPHSPHTPPERLFKKYADKTESPHIARYWAMCEWFDETCGELLGYLDREGLSQNTIVLYVTDNGWIQSENSANFAPRNKTTPFDAGHRTPIMARWPGHIAPTKNESLASSIDLVPTLLAALGLPNPDHVQGINLLDSQAVKSRQHVYGECFTIRSQSLDDPAANILWRWVTDGRWRLILPRTFQAEGPLNTIPLDNYLKPDLQATLIDAQPMLFDLQTDPRELNNLTTDRPDVIAALRAKLDSHWTPKIAAPH
ncbi:MAG: sulfatase [Pirellula staleyi]